MLDKLGFRAATPPSKQNVRSAHNAVLSVVDKLLGERDVRAVIEHLNQRTAFRFTEISRFDPPILRGVFLYDRAHRGTIEPMAHVIDDSYSSIIRREKKPFWTEDSMMDARLPAHSARAAVRSYVGAPIRLSGGGIWGVLAHFDKKPRQIPEGEAELLLQVASLVSHELFAKSPAA